MGLPWPSTMALVANVVERATNRTSAGAMVWSSKTAVTASPMPMARS